MKKEINFRFAVLDTETWGLDARPEAFALACVYAHDGNFKKFFTKKEELINWLFTQQLFTHIFAHNSEYDLTTIFGNIYKNLDRSALFVGSLLISAKKNGVTFANSFAVLKSSVESLGKVLGIEKMELSDKFKNYEKNITKKIIDESDIEYCFRDCEIVYIFLKQIFEMTGEITLTIASAAIKIYNKKFSLKEYKYKKITEIFRNSYYGGRVEVFKFGNFKNIYKYDINSLYPYVCLNLNFPNPNFLLKIKNPILKTFLADIEHKEGCAKVVVESLSESVGSLPYKKDGELIYPVGKFEGWYNFNELRFAVKKKYIKIISVVEYVAAPPIRLYGLESYMKSFYSLKNKSDGAEKLLNKFLLNSLTGKFSQKAHPDRIYFDTEEEAFSHIKREKISLKKINIKHFSKERNDVFLEIDKDDFKTSSWVAPFISSYITSAARCKMLPFFHENKNELIYTDTDSLILTKKLDKKYVDEDSIGFFKREKEDEVTIHGNKHYDSFISGIKKSYHKGVPKKAVEKDGVFFFKKMIKTKEGIRRNISAGEFVDFRKKDVKKYTKRIVLSNGETRPVKI